MLTTIRNLSLKTMLAYLEDCHGVTAYDLNERDVNTRSKSDVADVIECYGWAVDCAEYAR